MKHIFIINPQAGIVDRAADLLQRIEAYFKASEMDYYAFVTEGPGQASEIVRILCGFFPNEKVRFYSCGGDGTLFEVVNGISDYLTTEVAMMPIGKHNDTLALFQQDKASFRDIHRLVHGVSVPLDVLHVNDTYYAMNRICFGLDEKVITDVSSKLFSYVRAFSPTLFATALSIKHLVALRVHDYIMDSDSGEYTMPINFGVIMTKRRHSAKFFNDYDQENYDDALKAVVVKKRLAIHALSTLSESQAGKFSLNESGISVYDGKNFTFIREDSSHMMLSMDGEIISASNVCVNACPGLINFVIPSDMSGDF